MAEGAPLLREYTLIAYRGFESLLLRHLIKKGPTGPFFYDVEEAGKRVLGCDHMRLKKHLTQGRQSDKVRSGSTLLCFPGFFVAN